MDFSRSSAAVPTGISYTDRTLSALPPSHPLSPTSSLKNSRSSSDMDFDPRDDRSGPTKFARSDTFPLKVQIANNGILGSLVRSNSMVSDGRLGCSPTGSTRSDGALLGNDTNYMGDARLMRNESVVSYSGGAPRAVAYHHQAFPFKSSGTKCTVACKHKGLPLAMSTYGVVHEGERGIEPVVFTASQLRELQLQALIFKHLMCGVNVPPELVLPIRTSVLAGMTTGAHNLASIGWGNYHLGYGNSTDPEPGRCRRTDGKKWRCSRDVVPDQKYCERHMHRGRHRARKPPEAQSAVASTITSSSGATQPPSASLVSSSSSPVTMAAARAAVGGDSTSSPAASFPRPSSIALNLHQQQQQQQRSASGSPGLGVKSFSGSSSSPNSGALSIGSSVHGSSFQQQLALQTTGIKDFRYMSGDLSQEHTFFSDARGLSQESPTLSGLTVISSAVNNPVRAMQAKQQQQQQQHSFFGGGFDVGRESEGQPLRPFFDDWPRGRDPASLAWPDVEEDRSNRSSSTTQLSISIPIVSTDFTSNGNSPRGKLALSPLKLSMSRAGEDVDPLGVDAATQMGLGVGLGVNEAERQRQQQWVPITWESSSVGGPLAEVLQSSSNTPRGGTAACKSSGLNLMTDAWEPSPRNSPPMASSPTGVLQINATFGSFSDTSTASSPRSAALKGPDSRA